VDGRWAGLVRVGTVLTQDKHAMSAPDPPVWAQVLRRQPDRALAELAAGGLPVAFAVLADRHRTRLEAAAAGDSARVDSALVAAWTALRTGARPGDVGAWLEQAVRDGGAAAGDAASDLDEAHEAQLRRQVSTLLGADELPAVPPALPGAGTARPAAATGSRRRVALTAGAVAGSLAVAAVVLGLTGALSSSGPDGDDAVRAGQAKPPGRDVPAPAAAAEGGTTSRTAATHHERRPSRRRAGTTTRRRKHHAARGHRVPATLDTAAVIAAPPEPAVAAPPPASPPAADTRPKRRRDGAGRPRPAKPPIATVPLPTTTTTVPPLTIAPTTTTAPAVPTTPAPPPADTTTQPSATPPPATTLDGQTDTAPPPATTPQTTTAPAP